MARLLWEPQEIDNFGLDRGVLYLSNGKGVAWNGLVDVELDESNEYAAVYIDGQKVSHRLAPGDFSGKVRAFTYPDEFLEYEAGLGGLFGLSYRVGSKIHILYGLRAVAEPQEFEGVADFASPNEFSWIISSVPQYLVDLRRTSHIVVETEGYDNVLMAALEQMLYGDDAVDAQLPTLEDFVDFIVKWKRLTVIDNGDGTWTAYSPYEDVINMLDVTTFEIVDINAEYLDADTYVISDTEEA